MPAARRLLCRCTAPQPAAGIPGPRNSGGDGETGDSGGCCSTLGRACSDAGSAFIAAAGAPIGIAGSGDVASWQPPGQRRGR